MAFIFLMNTTLAHSILNEETILPESYTRLKKQQEDVYYCMSLHTTGATPRFMPLGNRQGYFTPKSYFGDEYQRIFTNRLLSKHPREGEETFQWRLSQYRPITRTPFLQIIELTSSSIFQDSNYYVEVSDISEDKYIKGANFDRLSLISWIKQIGMQSIVEDPNGYIVRIPSKPYNEIDTEKISVDIWFVKSIDIVYKDETSILFRRGSFAYLIDTEDIWRFPKVGVGNEYGEAQGYFHHDLGRLPVTIAGGVWNTQGFYDSYLVKAQAVADEYISSYSSEQLVDKEASHPFIVQGEEDCKYCNGTGEEVVDCDGGDNCENGFMRINCHVCDGKGTISTNPGERKIVPMEDMDKEHIKIINPDTTINSYHHKKNSDLYDMMIDALNLWRIEQRQSGTAKIIDQERLYLFISNISNHIFDRIITETVRDILDYRNVKVVNGRTIPSNISFTVMKPSQYQVKSSMDLLNEYKEGVISGLPFYIRAKMAMDFINRQYSGDLVMKKQATIIWEMDAIYCYTANEKRRALESGGISVEDVSRSAQIPFLINQLISENSEEWFMEEPKSNIKKEIERRFQKIFKRQQEMTNPFIGGGGGYDYENTDNVTK